MWYICLLFYRIADILKIRIFFVKKTEQTVEAQFVEEEENKKEKSDSDSDIGDKGTDPKIVTK